MKTTTCKKFLLATAAFTLMGLDAMANPAAAFDNVNWSWDKTVTENVLKDVNVNINTSPSGMAELEKIQTHVGDVTANSTVSNITNTPPGEQALPAPAPGPTVYTIDLKAHYDDNTYNNPIDYVTLLNGGETALDLSNATGHVDKNRDKVYLSFDLTMQEEEPAPAPIPVGERLGVDLPAVASAATAIGNNQNIDSSVSTELHDGQYLFGGFTEESSSMLDEFLASAPDTGNTQTDIAAGLILASAMGLIEPASITADSTVTSILNASVNSDATAVGNNMSVDLAAFTPDDAFMIADVTQVAYADVSATSLVDNVTIEGYSDLGIAGLGSCGGCIEGEPQIPLVKSNATAVGNNLSIKISSPSL